MDPARAFDIICSALKNVLPSVAEQPRLELTLMSDLGLESIDVMNLFVEIERLAKLRLDLTDIMRQREGVRAYQRDLTLDDIRQFLIKSHK